MKSIHSVVLVSTWHFASLGMSGLIRNVLSQYFLFVETFHVY